MLHEILEEFKKLNNLVERVSPLRHAVGRINGSNVSDIAEGLLPPKYDILGSIVEEKGQFNIVDADGVKMLNKDYPSLKQMLLDLANNL